MRGEGGDFVGYAQATRLNQSQWQLWMAKMEDS